jgi:hypothetical protein
VNNASLEFGLSYVVDYTKRAAKIDELFTKIAQEVTNSNGRLAWASSATTVTVKPAAPDAIASQPFSSARGVGQGSDSH